MRGIHRGPVNSPHKWPVTRKLFPFDDAIVVGLGWGWWCLGAAVTAGFLYKIQNSRALILTQRVHMPRTWDVLSPMWRHRNIHGYYETCCMKRHRSGNIAESLIRVFVSMKHWQVCWHTYDTVSQSKYIVSNYQLQNATRCQDRIGNNRTKNRQLQYISRYGNCENRNIFTSYVYLVCKNILYS